MDTRTASTSRRAAAALAVAALLAGAAACGGSSSSADQAKTNACNAKADIASQVQTLKGLPPTLASVDTAKTALTKIGDDLSTIQDNAAQVSGDLKQQLTDANAQFKSQVTQIGQTITSTQSLSEAATALATAGDKLAADYHQAFGNVSCG
jgi:hypothetical protein